MYNHYFNETTKLYTHSLQCNPNSIAPTNAIRDEDQIEIKNNFWPIVNNEKTSFIEIEDHRQRANDFGALTGGTPFWLPEDKYDATPRYMDTPGALPSNALLAPPEMTAEEKTEKRKKEILMELSQIDTEYRTARVLGGLALNDQYALEQWQKAEELAEPLREELKSL